MTAPEPRYRKVLLKISGEVLMGDSLFGIDTVTLDRVAAGLDQVSLDHHLALQGALEKAGVDTRVQSAIPMDAVCEPYIRRKALRHLEKGRVVIFAAGLGAPFFTTDTSAALRSAEMGCDALLKGTSVDGVYTADPKKDASARRYESLSYHDVLAQDLKVMDASAIALMRDNQIPILVFSIREPGNFMKVLTGEGVFTTIN